MRSQFCVAARSQFPPLPRHVTAAAARVLGTVSLMTPLPTVNLATGAPAQAQSERSDVTAVPAMGVIAEALVAIVLADAMLEKFGGDSLGELRRNVESYLATLRHRWDSLAPGD